MPGFHPSVAALAVLCAGSPTAVLALSEVTLCADPQLAVQGAAPDVAGLACGFALEAKAALLACGLMQTDPIEIRLVDKIEDVGGDCLASYDCTDNIIRVTHPEAIPDRLIDGSAYAALPTEVVFQALLSHEMSHAFLAQSSPGVDVAFVDHEFVAAAMELEIIGPRWREILVDGAPVSLPPKRDLISALIYGFEPRKFATNAWQYFDAEEDGCDRVRAIASGRFSFADGAADWP